MDPVILKRRAEYVHRAIAVLTDRGSATPPSAGKLIADYLDAHVEEFGDIAEILHWLTNIECALQSFREELRAIRS
jgi:hypothetical protein